MKAICFLTITCKRILTFSIFLFICFYSSGQVLPIEQPEKAGLSAECLNRIDAVMTLYEEGYFLLTDPVSKFIPEFKNPRVVMKSLTSDSTILVPAKNEITIRQLLNHTSGITYGEGLQGSYYRKAGMTVGLAPTEGTIDEC